VRKLAERSQKAAKEIGELAGNSVTTAERAGKLLDEIVPSIQKTSELVQEIAAASTEQSESVLQIGGAMDQLSKATQQNASASEQLAATSEELLGQAEQLQQSIAFFNIGEGPVVVRDRHAPTLESRAAAPRLATSFRAAVQQERLFLTHDNVEARQALLKELASAVDAHAAWRTKFRAAISKQEKMDADAISVDNRCALGKWLHGPGQHQCGKQPDFMELIKRHKTFHSEAGEVARLINAGQFARAGNSLSGATPFMRASSDVVRAIGVLRRLVD
jgi:methyl-accepting chemotaxis protein